MNKGFRTVTSHVWRILPCLLLIFTLLPVDGRAATPNFYSGFRDLPTSVHLYKFKGHARKTFLFVTALPQLYVFNAKGQEILKHTGAYDHPSRAFNSVFVRPKGVVGRLTLTQQLRTVEPIDDQPTPRLASDTQFTVVEYWASWCKYCFEERDNLLAFFSAHPSITVNWVTVDADYK